MKVSAVIPAYNVENTISQTIESLLRQDNKIDEIIVVDDGSNDKTPEIISKYPVVLIKKRHQGEATALNAGIKKASGDYIAIVEADVILPDNWLSALAGELKNPQVYGAGAAMEEARPENLIARLSGYELEYRYQKIKDKFVSHITSANTLYKKDVFEKVGYYNESLINASLDAELNGRLIKRGYKLVLRRDIKVKHFWKTSLFSYLKRQFAYSFYRPYQKNIFLYPTDKEIAYQILITFVFLASFLLWPFWKSAGSITAFLFVILLFMQTPLVIKVFQLKKDFAAYWLFPLIFFRNIVGVFGFILGFSSKVFTRR